LGYALDKAFRKHKKHQRFAGCTKVKECANCFPKQIGTWREVGLNDIQSRGTRRQMRKVAAYFLQKKYMALNTPRGVACLIKDQEGKCWPFLTLPAILGHLRTSTDLKCLSLRSGIRNGSATKAPLSQKTAKLTGYLRLFKLTSKKLVAPQRQNQLPKVTRRNQVPMTV